jgi:hypothetical protein
LKRERCDRNTPKQEAGRDPKYAEFGFIESLEAIRGELAVMIGVIQDPPGAIF